jgi:hypothetical protein
MHANSLSSLAGSMLVLVGIACAQPARSQAPNCANPPSARNCVLHISHEGGWFTKDRFIMDIEPAIPPSNATSTVPVLWLLPEGFVFANARQGPQLLSATPIPPSGLFIDNSVTDSTFNKINGPGIGFHWAIASGQPMTTNYKYNVVFEEVGFFGNRRWTCDPTIASFGGQAIGSRVSSPVQMNCTSP